MERAGGVSVVMFGEENLTILSQARQFVADGLAQVQLLAKPRRDDARKCREPKRRDSEIRFQYARELGDRLVVEDDGVELRGVEPGVFQAELDGARRETFVVLLAGETFLLCGGHDRSIAQQSGGGIVVEARDAEDMPHMKGYISGASTLPVLNTITAPRMSSRTTSGMSHHFFSCRRKSRNSLNNCHMISK